MSNSKPSAIDTLIDKIRQLVEYCTTGVWSDPRLNFKTRIIKTLNLSISSFFDRGLQNISMALTYSTVLSIVPAFALLVAIGRGFGLQDSMQNALYNAFPSQHRVVDLVMHFVDSYLTSATQGIFVGVGIILLLWTVISLLSQIETAFNAIWGVKQQRAFYQKLTDYIAICLMIPILIICASGVSFFMSDIIQDNINLPFISEGLNILLGFAPLILIWAAFTLSYYLIPNTKVEFKYAAISGALIAVGFDILQLLFLNGQIYVSKYNAIYGSFAFLPLLLVWLQLSWLLLLAGCMLTFSMQNVFTFNLMGDASNVSVRGWHHVALIIMAVVCRRFEKGETPLSDTDLAVQQYLPVKIVADVADKLRKGKLIYDVKLSGNATGISPAVEISSLSVGEFLRRYDSTGSSDLIPNFKEIYSDFIKTIDPDGKKAYSDFDSILVKDLPVPDQQTILKLLGPDKV